MAEQIPYNIASTLINRLASLAFREIGLIYGVTDELERLKNTVELINAVLLDADKRQHHEDAIQLWIRSLKGVLHLADDLFDEISTQELRLKVDGGNKTVAKVRRFFSSSNSILFHRKMACRIEKIREDFDHVVKDMSDLRLSLAATVMVSQTESAWRETSSFVLETDIIGREDSKREILSLLRQPNDDQNVSSIAIVGMGGLGKTTIVQLVYNDKEVQSLFEKRMWVCVSDDFDVKTIVRKMLESLSGTKSNEQESFDNLQNRLREDLNGRKYLLVLDDIWNESHEKWIQLRTYLMGGAQGSKIIVTTRSEIVAKAMGVNSPFVLKGLTMEQSWSLLKNIAFRDNIQGLNHTLESIGEKVAEICKGVPLAIRTVAGILHGKDKESEWIEVLEGDFWKQYEDENSIMPVLKLSYQYLSPELKQCFAYCSIYPKDWEIEKNELIQLWMAQGYLECSNERQYMEDVGYGFVKTLLMKSFFQDAVIDEDGDIIRFKMHDFMHDLALLVAGNDCYLDCERAVNRPLHISLDDKAIDLLDSIDGSRLRTFFLRSYQPQKMFQLRERLSVKFKCLRVLNLSYSSFTKLPNSIDKFNHLRYLDLSACLNLYSLPNSICNLVNLQTLKLSNCESLDENSVQVVTRLINLRHLHISGCKAFVDMMPVGLEKLSSLQSLSEFVVGDGRKKNAAKLNELKGLNNLSGELKIYELGRVRDATLESQEVNLKGKKHLDAIFLDFGGNDDNNYDSLQLLDNLHPHQHLKRLTVWRYPGVKFSNWISSLTNVSHITLSEFDNCRYLPPLEHLPSLKSLVIEELTALEHIYFEQVSLTAGAFFPSLEVLSINHCMNLQGWHRMGDDVPVLLPPFPHLSRLTITYCPKLSCMPTFPNLDEELQLGYCMAKPLIETLDIESSSSFAPLSMLKSLEIKEKLQGEEDLPNHWMRNLTSLEHLLFMFAEEFEIWSMDCLPSLQKLELSDCLIHALPDGICNSLSLQHIIISECPDLVSLPEGVPRLTNLQTLEIVACAHLLERCQRETGADWPKISHVPNIILRER